LFVYQFLERIFSLLQLWIKLTTNPSSTTATTSFSGTSISIFQQPTWDKKVEVLEKLPINSKIENVPELPDSTTSAQTLEK
jgi:hypothetical protein